MVKNKHPNLRGFSTSRLPPCWLAGWPSMRGHLLPGSTDLLHTFYIAVFLLSLLLTLLVDSSRILFQSLQCWPPLSPACPGCYCERQSSSSFEVSFLQSRPHNDQGAGDKNPELLKSKNAYEPAWVSSEQCRGGSATCPPTVQHDRSIYVAVFWNSVSQLNLL